MREDSPFGRMPMTDGGVLLCAGCAATATCQVGMRSQHVDPDGTTVAELVCPPNFAGGPGVAFGGWVSMAFDHALGAVPMWLGIGGLTVNLSVDFLAPVPVGVPVVVRGRPERNDGKRWALAAEMVLPDDRVAARARCLLVEPAATHFDAYRPPPT